MTDKIDFDSIINANKTKIDFDSLTKKKELIENAEKNDEEVEEERGFVDNFIEGSKGVAQGGIKGVEEYARAKKEEKDDLKYLRQNYSKIVNKKYS